MLKSNGKRRKKNENNNGGRHNGFMLEEGRKGGEVEKAMGREHFKVKVVTELA